MDSRLQELNDETVRVLIPAIVVVTLLMIIGLIGNPLVIYFFGFRVKRTASYMFIVTLACFDFITCSVSMPLEIVDIVRFYTFENSNACRLLRFVNYFASIASAAILIAIAVDRFRRICKPFNKQISNQSAKFIIMGVMAFSLFCSWPSIAIYTVVAVNITTSSESVIGYDCTTIRDKEYRFYITIYNIVLFLLFIGTIVVLIVLYSLVGKQLFKLKSFRFYATKRRTQKSQKSSSDAATPSGTQITDNYSKSDEEKGIATVSEATEGTVSLSSKGGLKIASQSISTNSNTMSEGSFRKLEPHESVKENVSPQTHENGENKSNTNVKTFINETGSGTANPFTDISTERPSQKIENNKKMHSQNIDTKKYTIITILISVGFIISFLPYLCLITWRTLSPGYEPNMVSDSAHVAFQIFLRSFLFSSVCNPIIYGFLNSDFKNMITSNIKRLCCCCWHVPGGRDKSSNPVNSVLSKST